LPMFQRLMIDDSGALSPPRARYSAMAATHHGRPLLHVILRRVKPPRAPHFRQLQNCKPP
jgi:hypothetical protein